MTSITIVNQNLRDVVRPNVLPNVLNIGLTGRMGAGKSTFARLLKEQGAAVVDMDQISRQITAKDGLAIAPIREAFGDGMIESSGTLDRGRMRELIVRDARAKTQLERITHSIISIEAIRQAHEAALLNPMCIIYDIPLLVDNHRWLDVLDGIIVVWCEREVQIARVLQRNPELNREMVEAIINVQAKDQQLLKIGDVIVDNSENYTNHLQACNQVNILAKYIKNLSLSKLNL